MRTRIGFVLGSAVGFYVGAKAGQQGLDRVTGLVSKLGGSAGAGMRSSTAPGSPPAGDSKRPGSGVITDIAAAGGAESSLATEVHGHDHPDRAHAPGGAN